MDVARCTARSRLGASMLRCTSAPSLRPSHQTLTSSARVFAYLSPSSRSVLYGPTTTPAAVSFASTHTLRGWEPPSDNNPTTTTANSSDKERDAATSLPSDEESDVGGTPAPAMAHPYSTRAYRARLQSGNYASLRELTRAAYAPSSLQVLVDLLSLAVSRESPAAAAKNTAGLHTALARAVDVRWVLSDTIADAKDVVLAAETVGDAASHAALQELLQQLEMLANATEAAARGVPAEDSEEPLLLLPGVEGDDQHHREGIAERAKSSTWVLPEATHATLLRGVLQLAAVVGAPLHALSALDELIALQGRLQRAQSRESTNEEVEEDEGSFSMDDALTLVDAAAQRHIPSLTAHDHLCAMEACATEYHRDFRTTLSLYHRFVQHVTAGRFAATPADFTAALTALAHSSRTTTDFSELRALMVESEAAATVPVSVPLYTALIDAASRAVEEPRRMAIALSLYRRLRDGALTPTADTYAALIACCASTQEPTQAFAFYHEARSVCGVASFTPRVYTNLLLSYSSGGYGADAKKTLEVLVEAGAPLTRASFHAALASAVTVREAEEMMSLMTERYHILPTPHTYSYLVRAIAAVPSGVQTALQLFDAHEEALRALARLSPTDGDAGAASKETSAGGVAVSTSVAGVSLEPLLLERYPAYVRALEAALMRLRVDPSQDPRMKAYLTPLVRVAQQRMNAFTGMPPQSPLHVPERERLCIAVLAADALANLDEYVMPFLAHYSVLVIPYSALLALQSGGGRRVDGAMAKGTAAGLHDAVWQHTEGGSERDAVVEHRRLRLQRFLTTHRNVVHLLSLEEELRWSRETRRYGVGVTDLFARAAATALHLARQPEEGGSGASVEDGGRGSVYARHPSASIVLVSADYERCGRHVVALKQAGGGGGSAGLRAALRRVSYHNPRTNPNWVPPTLSVNQQQQRQQQQGEGQEQKKSSGAAPEHAAAPVSPHVVAGVEAARPSAVDVEAAAAMYRHLLSSNHPSSDDEDAAKSAAAAGRDVPAAATEDEEEEDLSADDLMSLLNS